MAWLQQCDIFVAEVSGSSFGLGCESGYLLGATTKKVILLYRFDHERKVSLLITGNTHPRCTLVPYSTIEEFEAFIRDALPSEPSQAGCADRAMAQDEQKRARSLHPR
jgi:hypothetical protein